MIEKWLKNDLSKKRWRRFKSKKRALYSVWALAFVAFLSCTAEFWANSKPLLLNYSGNLYMPVLFDYHPSVFGIADQVVTDYRKLPLNDGDWKLWPPIQWDPYESNNTVETFPSPPSKDNLLGTDDRGRDVLTRLLYGFRYSLAYALAVWFFAFTIGTLCGAVMGFAGGWVDLIGQRAIEIFESMPVFLLLLTISSIFNPNLFLLVVISSVFGWMLISLYVRAEFLKLRKRDFVDAARALGASRWRQIRQHILPNALTPLIVFTPFTISGYIAALANLDYLGFGLRPPTPSWGELLAQARNYFTIAWWLAVFTSLALFFTLLILNFIGEGVRDAYDPRK